MFPEPVCKALVKNAPACGIKLLLTKACRCVMYVHPAWRLVNAPFYVSKAPPVFAYVGVSSVQARCCPRNPLADRACHSVCRAIRCGVFSMSFLGGP